jgi:hypothetical protein
MKPFSKWTDKELAEEYYNISLNLDAASENDYAGSYSISDEISNIAIRAHLLYRKIIVCPECGKYWKVEDKEEFECPDCGELDFIDREEYDSLVEEAEKTLKKYYKKEKRK